MTCFLLHTMEDPDRDAYRDPALLDLIGLPPRFFCARCAPLKALLPSEALRCMHQDEPCWMPEGPACSGQSDDSFED